MLDVHLVLELLAVAERDDLMAGVAKDRLHELQVGVGVVDHHYLRHRTRASLTEPRAGQKCNGAAIP